MLAAWSFPPRAEGKNMTETAPPVRPPLAAISKFSYSIGSVAYGLKATALGLVMLFYNQVMGLPVVWVSSGIGVALIIDAIVDPMIGQISDMWRSKWGRRHPFMYFSAVPTSLAVWALINAPHGWSNENLFIYMMVCIVSARVFISMFEIPSTSLLPELAPNYDDRTTILSYRYLFGVVGPIAMSVFALNVFLTPFVNEHGQHMPGQLNPAGYPRYALALASVIFISIMLSALGTHREIKYMRPPVKHASLAALIATIGTTLLNRNFMALTLAGIIAGIGTGLVGGLGIYFATYFWELSSREISLITFASIIAPFAATALGPMLAKKLGKKPAVLWTFFLSVFIGVVPISLRLLGVLPPNGNPIIVPLLIVDGVITATLGIVGFIIVSSMMADIVEQVQTQTGRRSEGLLFSADNLLKQVVTGVGSMGTGFIVQFVHFPAKAIPGHVAADVLNNLALIYLPISATTNIVAISVISFYSISRADHENNLVRVSQATEIAEETGAVERGEAVSVAAAKPF
jgi:GPH family glycoside/pentoside/hexuronide:cation symporter